MNDEEMIMDITEPKSCPHGYVFISKCPVCSGWVSVKDSLPNHHDTILAHTKKGECVCIFVDTKEMNKTLKSKGYPEECWDEYKKPYAFCSQELSGHVLNGVSHWMNIPEPPGDES